MLRDHPDLSPDYQGPLLRVVSRAEIEFAEWINGREVYERVARGWDGYVDAGKVREGSFGVVVEAVVGVKGEGVGVGREFKRMAEEGDGEGHRAKRRRAE